MTYLLIGFFSLLFGLAAGCRLTWFWMEREWQRNPYAFRQIVDEVIALRSREGRLP